jgi:protein-serine/threonine kinase
LPPAWKALLSQSHITKEDMANNPQAVIDVLGFFADNISSKPSKQEDIGGNATAISSPKLPADAKPVETHLPQHMDETRSRSGSNLKKCNVPPPPPTRPPIVPRPEIDKPKPIDIVKAEPKSKENTTDIAPIKAKELEKRLSGLSEIELLEVLREMVSKDDPVKIYTKIKSIGHGASGSVYLAKNNVNSNIVAIKEININRQPRKDMVINEIRIMRESQHPSIVSFVDCFIVRDNLWVIMEYMEGGMLTDIIDRVKFTEPQIATICLEVFFT